MGTKQIDNWLDSRRDIEAGRELLKNFPQTNPTLLKLIMTYSNSGTQDLIAKELERIQKLMHVPKRPATIQALQSVAPTQQYDLPPNLAELNQATKRKYQELDTLRGKAKALPEGDDLKEAALRIIRLRKEINANYSRIRYFQKFGVEPAKPVGELDQVGQVAQLTRWLRAQKTHRPYISKHKKSRDTEIMKEVARRQQELADIDEYLANAIS